MTQDPLRWKDAQARAIAVTLLLVGGRKVSAEELAERFGVTLRTIYRDIAKLQKTLPIKSSTGPGGGYVLAPNVDVESSLFGGDGGVATLLTNRGILWTQEQSRNEAIQRALKRAEDALRPEDKEFIRSIRERIYFDTEEWYSQEKPPEDLQMIRAAVLQDRRLKIVFRERNSPALLEDTVDPIGLVWKGGFWYLVAYSHREHQYRRYRVQRIVEVTDTGENFVRDPNVDLVDVWRHDLDRFGVGATKVIMRIRGSAIAEFENFNWKPEDKITKFEDYWLVESPQDRLEWLVPIALSYAGDVEIVEPEELRQRVVEEALNVVKAHGAPAPHPGDKGTSLGEYGDIRSRAVRGRGLASGGVS